MSGIIWTIAGALTGLLLHMLITRKSLSALGSVVTGAAAALAGGWLLAPLFGLAQVGEIDVIGLVVALVSAVVGLSIVNMYREEA